MSNYVDKIIRHVKYTSQYKQYKTIYLGGGTPNHLPDNALEKLLLNLQMYLDDDYEFSIECNPDLITDQQVQIFKKCGINRVSLGVQTTNDFILKKMHRTHTINDVIKAIKKLQHVEIMNINCDFIYDLPGVTNEDIITSVNLIKNHNIPHASFYALEIKTNAILNKQHYVLDVENQEDKMLFLQKLLKDYGYQRYEVSNWVLNKKDVCQHNLAYWLSHDWKAIGYGGCGFENQNRYEILGNINNFYVSKCEKLSQSDYYFQILMMGLRLSDGLDLNQDIYYQAFDFYKDKLINYTIDDNNHLKANNIDLLDDILVELI